jgi:hypothetical protein
MMMLVMWTVDMENGQIGVHVRNQRLDYLLDSEKETHHQQRAMALPAPSLWKRSTRTVTWMPVLIKAATSVE